MRFSYNWLKELVKFKESPQALAELLTLRSFEVEVAGKVGGDWSLEAKIPTNRISDAASHWGLAGEIAAIKSTPRATQESHTLPKSTPARIPAVKIKVAAPAICSRYTSQELEIDALETSPKWMRDRLATCGFRSVNNVVDVTNYVMLETGQPLHAFDLDKIIGRRITIRLSRAGEELTTLDGTRHRLPAGVAVIQDAERLIDLAGIMGGENSAVSGKTRRILLQAATFDPIRTYRSMRALGFSSEAAKLYAAGIDPNRTAPALERAVALLREIAGATPSSRPMDLYPRRVRPRKIRFRPDYASQMIGERISRAFYQTLWRRLGFKAQEQGGSWLLEIPTERRDIQIEEDLIEEAARLFGYEQLRQEPPHAPLAPGGTNEERAWEERIRDTLVGAGFTEAHTYTFVGPATLGHFGASPTDLLELENPMGPETRYLGAHPAQQYLKIAAENLRRFERVAIFGIAKGFKRAARPSPKKPAFAKAPADKPAEERKYLVMVKATRSTSSGQAKRAKDTKANESETFYEVKGTLDSLFESLGIADHWYDDALTPAEREKTVALHPYRTAKVMIGDEFLGVVAELHPAVQQRLKSKARLVFSHIDFEKLWKLARAEAEFKPMGKYPAVIRDIAVIVPEDTKADDVEGVIQNAGGALLADSDLFDYFQDEAMTERSEKSLAFHLVFQSSERTLTDGEVNRIYKKIVSAVKREDWEVRE